MSMVFRFRMLSDENDNFVRDYEAMYDMTLLDFHDFDRFFMNQFVFQFFQQSRDGAAVQTVVGEVGRHA